MRGVRGVRVGALLVGLALVAAACGGGDDEGGDAGTGGGGGEAKKIGVVYDIGGRGDKSFNDGAYLGAERAQRELGARVRFIEPGEGSDREAGLRLLAAEGVDLVIGVGFIFTDDLTALAREYPNTAFADIPKELQSAIAESPRAAFTRLLKEGYSVGPRQEQSSRPLDRVPERPRHGPGHPDRRGPPRGFRRSPRPATSPSVPGTRRSRRRRSRRVRMDRQCGSDCRWRHSHSPSCTPSR